MAHLRAATKQIEEPRDHTGCLKEWRQKGVLDGAEIAFYQTRINRAKRPPGRRDSALRIGQSKMMALFATQPSWQTIEGR